MVPPRLCLPGKSFVPRDQISTEGVVELTRGREEPLKRSLARLIVRPLLATSLVIALFVGEAPSAYAASCGVERWAVKTGTDQDAGVVNLASVSPTTVAALIAKPPPVPIPGNSRVAPVETTVWRIDAVLTLYKREDDSDYHLVLTDSAQNTMIVEIPKPDCVGAGSPFSPAIAVARSEFDAQLHATTGPKTVNIPVRVTGVGFFDFIHGQTGVAPNGIELHPVLDISFNPPPATKTAELLVDGGFEPDPLPGGAGPAWTSTTNLPGNETIRSDGIHPRTGVGYASLGGRNGAIDELAQTLFIPASATKASLTFWARVDTQEASGSGPFDFLSAEIREPDGPVLATAGALDERSAAAGGYVQAGSVDLSNFIGRAVQIAFHATTDPSLPTTFSIDDVSVTASLPGGGDATPPITVVTSPPDGTTATGTLDVIVNASDDSAVARLELYIDGILRSSTDGGGFLSFRWVTTGEAGGVHSLHSKAYDAAGNVWSSPTVSVTVSNPAQAQLLLNPGFEGGADGTSWSATSGVVTVNPGEPARTGTGKAWLDGYGHSHTDTLSQQVVLPATGVASLSFWLHVDTQETGGIWDGLSVEVRSPTGAALRTLGSFSNSDAATGYRQVRFDLSEFKGQVIVILVTGKEDDSLSTSFVLDDFAIDVA
jgi:hypothetical protein